MTDKEFAAVLQRLDKLEKAVFAKETKAMASAKGSDAYTGLVGGIRLIIDKGFFDEDRGLSEIRTELAGNGYRYSVQAVHTAISRLSKASGPLVAFKENGKKTYAKRK
ncbi:MAG: hypothetical protein WC217_02575 [Candidatus Paceibacterota bacterium]|jgi:hypothetical protein